MLKLKWWNRIKIFGFYPFIPLPPKTYDVGISVARAVLDDGTLITITRTGHVYYDDWYCKSTSEIRDVMLGKWVYADNCTYYNRHYIMSYTVSTKPYLVYHDNKSVEIEMEKD